MSFSISGLPIKRGDDVAAVVAEAWTAPVGGYAGNPSPRDGQVQNGTAVEADRAIAAAGTALATIADSLGTEWESASVSVSGHVNPGNAKREGWGNDFVGVTFAVAGYAEPAQ